MRYAMIAVLALASGCYMAHLPGGADPDDPCLDLVPRAGVCVYAHNDGVPGPEWGGGACRVVDVGDGGPALCQGE